MADGRHIAKCWKRYNSPIKSIWMKLGWSHPIMSPAAAMLHSKSHNSPTSWPTVTQLGWSHPIMFPTCPQWCGCHGNSHCLATTHWTFCSYGRLEAERVYQFCWNLVHNSKLGPQWQSHDQILIFFKFKMADGRHVVKYSKYHNSLTNGPIGTKLGWSHPIALLTCQP